MMTPNDPEKLQATLIKQINNGCIFAFVGQHSISNYKMITNDITILDNICAFNNNIKGQHKEAFSISGMNRVKNFLPANPQGNKEICPYSR